MIESRDDAYMTLAEATRHIPGRPHVSTVARWCTRGARGRRLASWLVGGRIFTRPSAIAEFIAERAASCGDNKSDTGHQSAAAAQADEALDREGII